MSREQLLRRIFAAGVDSVRPQTIFRNREIVKVVKDKEIQVWNGEKKITIDLPARTHVIGFGKGVFGLALEMERILGEHLTSGQINVPVNTVKSQPIQPNIIKVIEGARNNYPDEAAVEATIKLKHFVGALTQEDVLFVLITGGGSALLPLPNEGITLEDKLAVIKKLVRKGATINELNAVRIKMSGIKGGKLAQAASGARMIVSFIISDIVGDPIDLIASGPTVFPSTDGGNLQRPVDILNKYSLWTEIPANVRTVIERPDTLMVADRGDSGKSVENILIANNRLAVEGCLQEITRASDVSRVYLSNAVEGNVSEVSQSYFRLAKEVKRLLNSGEMLKRGDLSACFAALSVDEDRFVRELNEALAIGTTKICLVAGGETTVTLTGPGIGGRNQQMVLEFMRKCQEEKVDNVYLLSAGTDGIDGPTDAAGAIGSLDILQEQFKEEESNSLPQNILQNDSYNFLKSKPCHVIIGHTGTNVMDIQLLLIYDYEIRNNHSEAGIIPRFCQELFQRLDEAKGTIQAEVEVSYFEIYNEKIHDLLSVTTAPLSTSIPSGSTATPNATVTAAKKSLRVREHSIWGPYVVDLSTHPVDSHVALRNWLALGNSQRATAATGMNDKSSRSHSIFNIVLNLTERLGVDEPGKEEQIQTKRSKISLVDLAGSERVSCTGASGDRLKEGVSINKSLLTLGKVISALSTGKKGFIPYRESVLTWLLRENLGGNSRTVMLATISPASIHLDETLATLRYACQARTIINRVKVNEDPHDKIIRELRAEVDRLQSLQQDFDRQQMRQSIEPRKIIIETSADETEVKALKEELLETKQELAKAERSWLDRLKEAEAVRKTEMKMLQKKGLALEFSVEQRQACLVNLAADPMLSGTLLYIIPMGRVRVGRMRPAAFNDQPDIVLEGPLVAFDHCVIENEGRRLSIKPIAEDFETFINGELIEGKRKLYDGDRLVIGGSHYFRVSNPNCERRRDRQLHAGDGQVVVDFQWAHQEILVEQERRLREELEMEKQVALQQIREHQRAAEQEFEERLQSLEIEKHQIKCSKEILENEVAMYKTQNGAEDFLSCGVYKSGYQSTLLEDIQRMMARPTKESLHQIQLKVKEATKRCRDFAAPYEFRQTQKADALGIFHAVVTIIDRQKSKVAEWPPARLDVWLDMVRETDFDKDKLFDCVETVWMDWDELDMLEESFSGGGGDSMNASRIGLNLSAMRDKLMMVAGRSPQRSPLIKSVLKESAGSQQKRLRMKQQQIEAMGVKKSLNFDEENEEKPWPQRRVLGSKNGVIGSGEKLPQDRRVQCIQVELKDLQQGASRLKKLCTNGDAVKEVQKKALNKACHEIERQLAIIKAVLERSDDVENGDTAPADAVKTPKSVRFLLD